MNRRYQARERYSVGWTDTAPVLKQVMDENLPTFRYCETCKRETPHIAGCVYCEPS